MKKLALALLVGGFLSGCASHTNEISAAYVSPLQYDSYNCKQISAEMGRVSRRAQEVAFNVNKNADGDQTAMAVGLILFWPSLFFIDGDKPEAQEYARLKGEFDALEQAAIQKGCSIKVENDPFLELEKARKAQQQNPDGPEPAHKSIDKK
jgi:hypothetical protein